MSRSGVAPRHRGWPAWYSTIYDVHVFAGGVLSALGLLALLRHTAGARTSADARWYVVRTRGG